MFEFMFSKVSQAKSKSCIEFDFFWIANIKIRIWGRQYEIKYFFLNPIQDRGGQKGPCTSFSPVTPTNVGINLQNVLTFSFNFFDRLV